MKAKTKAKGPDYNYTPAGPVEVRHCPTCGHVITCRFCGLQKPDCDKWHPEHDYTPTA